ncbi:NAD-P-binding protein [Mycena sanguinolenta]|uniref:NAD-P-binding protein n=1 Tax=Mycena sanguinolenta TaxID=230812 RepID=A0A8H6YYR1_9AGAR|nr:NAD-P-binding protein [Mycena sanguinolenta]
MSSQSQSKLILVIGATGAQGRAVIDALLAPDASGHPSPYTVRALTRDPSSTFAQELTKRGVECVKGSFTDYAAYAGMRIYEVTKRVPSLRHYVWSNIRYVLKNGNFNPDYAADHMNAKGRVGEWLSVQPSELGDGLTWSQVTTGPYMIKGGIFNPLNVREDGTVVFAAPFGDAHVPLIALEDLGWWARYTFDHRTETSGKELNIASELVHWDDLARTFTKVTGRPAVYVRLTVDEFLAVFDEEKMAGPIASDKKRGDGSKTMRENFKAFYQVLRDDIVDKDMEWVRSVHPGTYTLERWMRETNYTGQAASVLKNTLDGKMDRGLRAEVAAQL